MKSGTLSIIIPQYKTETLTRLCLRSLKKYSQGDVQVIVVDNGSKDGSTEYLRSLSWIELIENKSGTVGGGAHWEALNLGIERARGEWICFFHSDTIVLRPGWDLDLLKKISSSGSAGLSTCLRDINMFERGLDRWKRRAKEFINEAKSHLPGNAARDRKVMSFCFIVQKSLVGEVGLALPGKSGEAVSVFYHEKIKGKHPFLLLGRAELEPILWHTSNATAILTGQMTEPRLLKKYYSKTGTLMGAAPIRDIMADISLDK